MSNMRDGLARLMLLGFSVCLGNTDAAPMTSGLPLTPVRTVLIDTDEGSWISLDVTPDGRTVVFDLLGDLYMVPLSGGAATSLTSGLAFDGQPRVSPDGQWVVFTSDRSGDENVWILNLSTQERRPISQLTDKAIQSPEWTPDGKNIVATVSGPLLEQPGTLWMFPIDGGSGFPLRKESPQRLMTGAAFGPDGRWLWYAEWQGEDKFPFKFHVNAIFPQYQIGTYDLETGARQVQTARQGSAMRPTLSPDGRWLVYASRYEANTGLVLRDLQSGEERWLAYPVQRDDQEANASRDAYPGMTFTPDSKEVVTTYGGKIWRVPIDGSAPRAVPFRVRTTVPIGPAFSFRYPITDSAEFIVRQIRDAVPSPDGTRLAFTALDRLYVVDGPHGSPRRLTQADEVEAQPTWSPDGKWVAYVTWQREGGQVLKVRADGRGVPHALAAQRAFYQRPAWAPDGTRLAVLRGPASARRLEEASAAEPTATSPLNAMELVAVPATGGVPSRIAAAQGRQTPHFTRDPNRIFLWDPVNGLVSIRWDGSDFKCHVKVTGPLMYGGDEAVPIDRILISPTADQVLIQATWDVYLASVPGVGGDPPLIDLRDPSSSVVSVRRLTEVGGEFATWSGDGRRVHWSLGNTFFTFDRDTSAVNERSVAVRVPRDTPQGTLVLRGARVITMRGAEILDGADIVIRHNRIVRIGREESLPEDAQLIDVSGKTIVPGFVDLHEHFYAAWEIHKEQPWMYLANLAYGVTTARDPQSGSSDIITEADRVEAGQIIGPRIYSTGPGLGYWLGAIRDRDEVRRRIQRYSRYWHTQYLKMYVTGNRQVRQWVALAAREAGLTPTTEGYAETKYQLTMLMDGYPGQEHNIPTLPLYQDVTTLYAQSGITYTPTLTTQWGGGPSPYTFFYQHEQPYHDAKVRRFMPYDSLARLTRRRGRDEFEPFGWFMDDEYVYREIAQTAAMIVSKGGKIGIGSHGEFQGLGYHWELWAIGSGGMPPHEVLRMATLTGAQAMGLDQDLGSLEPGKLADLLVLDRNPLDDLRNTNSIRYVMKNGRLYEGDTLNELWPRQRKTAPPYGIAETPKTAAGLHQSLP